MVDRPTTSRVGRENQRYNPETGARMVAGCICLNDTKDKVVMVQSMAHVGRWVLPKGGIELDEGDDFLVSAVRETWEEAGVEGRVMKKLEVVLDSRGKKAPVVSEITDAKVIPKSEFHFYELLVTSMSQDWPEADQRERRWCTYSDAVHELTRAKRPELIQALDLLSILKSSQVP
ncbi:uncharacterized protein CANTADRAFT_21901 [Suhomyces tanzawaensis NRRL Y-17324]|uniref:Nudix hydrolase domain-containing protein n=1 Tax=Suhomyces tanzawaensis NRRL Y-17324 TaxID=984487 RepID=A0A1E4SI78_9ASCO|nr:uncharacterized protein CANTADRAFT_21901 [Suhomyces tanzawaensis NRRL Y-17324]ODV79132.1 hypothetical protein CANTADRAFT_21901 [Suhomyces tanzawaensis NRRL Y-17324]